jgi:hypothetical protein
MLALLFGPLYMPSLLIDEFRVDDEKVEWNTGFWWAKEDRTLRYADILAIRVEHRKQFRHTETIWILRMVDGTVAEAVVTDIWRENYDEIRARFIAKGIPIDGDA